MTPIPQQGFTVNNNSLIIACGWLLIACGMALTMFIAYTAYQILAYPQDVALVQYVISQIPAADPSFFVITMTENHETSTIAIPQSFALIIYLLFTLLAFRVVSSCSVEIIRAGVQILTQVRNREK